MQLQRPMTLGAAATQNGGTASYNQLLMNCLADAAIAQYNIVVWDLAPVAGTGLLGHSVAPTTTPDLASVCGVAQHAAAVGEPVLVCSSGVSLVLATTANIAAAGAAIATDTVSGSAGDAANTPTTAEHSLAPAGISLEARSATVTGYALCYLRC